MNIAVGFVFLVAVAVLEGITGLSERQSNESQIGDHGGNNLADLNKERPAGNHARNRNCRREFGGICVKKRKECPEDRPLQILPGGRPYCSSKRRRCCFPDYECIFNNGTQFDYDGVTYCLKMEYANWTESRDWCEHIGMSIAQPEDPSGIATYINGAGNYCWFWLGGYGDGFNQVWLNGTVIPNGDNLWEPDAPNVTVDSCLALQTCGNLNTPLTTFPCSTYDGFSLCEAKTWRSMDIIKDDPFFGEENWIINEVDEDEDEVDEDELDEDEDDAEEEYN